MIESNGIKLSVGQAEAQKTVFVRAEMNSGRLLRLNRLHGFDT